MTVEKINKKIEKLIEKLMNVETNCDYDREIDLINRKIEVLKDYIYFKRDTNQYDS